ncbi:helix-turn-helix domain-containing protein [Cupriavidus sp. CV2]|uniref:helix-turn-helix domain-containing protein n=1 Tax=Cupriavidus ulmosensis TaxID=3065913 RepID=UPI00296B217C|nr:helix-turn-helix domain-containing protein [Cupriavidus sp. CV2]MDW3682959.1 helix-turn-helix domain-containing protein [Cupriavidus sp. CV2]
MSQVWERYPNGGGEMLLALALADHAHDDGTHIWPSVKQLSAKTRQSERTIQYQLRNMESAGWLLLCNAGNGGRNQHREYRINPDWLNGANFADLEKGAIHDVKGATDDAKGAIHDGKGCKPLHPHITTNNHQESSGTSKGRAQRDDTEEPSVLTAKHLIAEGVDKQVAKDWLTLRKAKRLPLTPTAWDAVKGEAAKVGLTPGQAVAFAVAANWAGFTAKWWERAEKPVNGGAPAVGGEWWTSTDGIKAKAGEIGLTWKEAGGEIFLWFKVRVFKKAGEGPWRQQLLRENERDEAMHARIMTAFYPPEDKE